jgi:uncharacterized membrane protein
MIIVTLFYREGDNTCLQVKEQLNSLQSEIAHHLVVVNVDEDSSLQSKYGKLVPVVKVGPYQLVYPFTYEQLKITLAAATDRENSLARLGKKTPVESEQSKMIISGADRFTLWFSRWYVWVFSLLIGLFVGIPFLAPVFLNAGWAIPAKVIYTVYSPLCHQYAFRSWFLFGEQSFYPRRLAGFSNLQTYEDIIGTPEIDSLQAKYFNGNSNVGYKIAICERDVAIWGSLLLFALIFQLTGKKIPPYKWAIYIWIIIGLIPIGIDGGSQLPGLLGTFGLSWLPIRESTPFLRSLTGSLFGMTTGYYVFPQMEETMKDARRMILHKIEVAKQVNTSRNQ